MPGSSLWLVPPADSALNSSLQTLISTTVPSLFARSQARPAHFVPHITITSDVFLADGTDPQSWLDSLDLTLKAAPSPARASTPVRVDLGAVEVGTIFFKKVTLQCESNGEVEREGEDGLSGLRALAAACRRDGVTGGDEQTARTWAVGTYAPHCSLMYSELPSAEVEAVKTEIVKAVDEARLAEPSLQRTLGGQIWLVQTHRPLDQWMPVGRRTLDDLVWEWHG